MEQALLLPTEDTATSPSFDLLDEARDLFAADRVTTQNGKQPAICSMAAC